MQNSDNVSPLSNIIKSKWFKVVVIVDILAFIAIIILVVYNSLKNAVISINVAPLDAKVALNGKADYKNGQYSLLPGKYEVTVSYDGLDSKTISINLEPHSVTTVSLYLTKDGDFDYYEQKDNYASYQKLYSIVSSENNRSSDNDTSAEKFVSSFEKKYSIFKDLPIIDKTPSPYGLSLGSRYQYDILTIKDGRALEECTKTLCLQITDTLGSKEDYAESVIDKFGYNHNDFQIIYQKVGYESEE
ncbi:carboxypeptidase regulatory-like domain-containing protein [Candidatus Saccharibacteria bacterium]|nr:carboxypeptidase regulatory-like domain-containing protein [Candidatus Saccharibacteria bacterium]